MSEVRIVGNQTLRRPITARGDSRGESLSSIDTHAETHTDWRDTLREGLGVIGLAPKVENIDWKSRKIGRDGRVKVTASDAFYGVSQPELQREYELYRRSNINQSEAGQEHFRLTGKEALSTDLSDTTSGRAVKTNEGDLVSSNATENTRRTDTKKLLDELSKIEVNGEGTALKATLLQQLKSNPKVSTDQISDAIAKVTKYNPTVIADRKQGAANLELTEQKITSQQAADALALRNEINATAIKMAEIDFNNKTNEYNWKTANADRDYKWRSDEADRDLKATLTQLGYEDKADERALAREDRAAENRQLMILQLIKGLSNLGGAFAP